MAEFPGNSATPGGMLRRRIRIVGTANAQGLPGGEVRADLEDDFHRFGLTLAHDGQAVTQITGEAHRFPWSTCPGGSQRLAELVGLELSPRCTTVAQASNPRLNCTHLFDLAGLALAAAWRGPGSRQYDAVVPEWVDGKSSPTLAVNGEEVLSWHVDSFVIKGPPPFEELALRGQGFMAWAEATLAPDLAEAAIVLRRAVYISPGRLQDLDALDRATELGDYVDLLVGMCHTLQPEMIPVALRMKGTTHDFTHSPEKLLSDLA